MTKRRRGKRNRRRTCAVHDFQPTDLKIATRRADVDGYRILRRCTNCKRTVHGPFIPVNGSLKASSGST